jgi:hypothetical protein
MRRRTAALTTALTVVLALIAANASLSAQGVADLRYAAPLPGTLVRVTVDSSRTESSAMTVTGEGRSVMHLSFAAGADGITATVQLQEMTFTMTTPMGVVPTARKGGDAQDVRLLETGPARASETNAPVGAMGSNPAAVMAEAVGHDLLPRLPGRMLSLGETWTDTTTSRAGDPSWAVEVTTITIGAYVADILVDGRALNVLRITSRQNVRGTGDVKEIRMEQATDISVEDTVHWDSALHYPVWRSVRRISDTEMRYPGQTQTVRMRAEQTTVSTATPLEPGG